LGFGLGPGSGLGSRSRTRSDLESYRKESDILTLSGTRSDPKRDRDARQK
jgi:hypothetical protein